MIRSVLLPTIVILLIGYIETNVAVRNVTPRPGSPSARCSEWSWGPCQNLTKTTCGRGTRKGTRTGECSNKEKTDSCKIPCPGEKKERCTFGPWTDGECKDGKMTSTRVIKTGGDECRRKAVKTKRCGGAGGAGKRRGGGAGNQE